MSALIGLALTAPLALAALLALPGRAGVSACRLAPWAALPAVVVALTAPLGTRLDLPWLLLGSRFGLDATGRVFLLFTALLWLLAGIYAGSYLAREDSPRRYFAYHLLTYAGNLGVVLAHDVVAFYLAFVLMTLAAFGLIVHSGTGAARRAAIVYLTMAIAAEGLLLAGVIVSASRAEGILLPALASVDIGPLASLLLVLGFGVKAGLPLLHMWLPLAHPEAPTPASAVLSGAMIKAGLLGWLRFLPLGEASEPRLGLALVAVGLFAAYAGAVVGVTQRKAKALLAYSSVSQMGFMTVAVGSALVLPATAASAVTAVSLFAFHHALTKGALFLGVGLADHGDPLPRTRRSLVTAGLALTGVALVGLPFTGGALAKTLVKDAVHPLLEQVPWTAPLPALLTLAATGTALLMLRLLALVNGAGGVENGRREAGMWLPWLGTLVLATGGPLLLAAQKGLLPHGIIDLSGAKAWELLWPALLAGALYLAFLRREVPQVPPGDVLVPLERFPLRIAAAFSSRLEPVELIGRPRRGGGARGRGWSLWRRLPDLERHLRRWDSAGALLLAIGALLALAFWAGSHG